MSIRLKKVLRYTSIYGIARTLTKVAGRKRGLFIFRPFFFNKDPFIGLLGCGQFQFSTIAFIYLNITQIVFISVMMWIKIMRIHLLVFIKFHISLIIMKIFLSYKNKTCLYSFKSCYPCRVCNRVFKKNVDVFCEKPICVNFNQFDSLLETIKNSSASFCWL